MHGLAQGEIKILEWIVDVVRTDTVWEAELPGRRTSRLGLHEMFKQAVALYLYTWDVWPVYDVTCAVLGCEVGAHRPTGIVVPRLSLGLVGSLRAGPQIEEFADGFAAMRSGRSGKVVMDWG